MEPLYLKKHFATRLAKAVALYVAPFFIPLSAQ
jgi:hypothetical protein